MFAKPEKEHAFLDGLLGEWEFTHHCSMGPEAPPQITRGTVSARSLGGLWALLECQGSHPEGGAWTSLFTLGYDPARKRYLGTFVASMMTHLWIYDGAVDETGKRLVLDCEGPSMAGPGLAKYQDIFEIVGPDHWVLRSRLFGTDGQWFEFMEGHHHRVAGR